MHFLLEGEAWWLLGHTATVSRTAGPSAGHSWHSGRSPSSLQSPKHRSQGRACTRGTSQLSRPQAWANRLPEGRLVWNGILLYGHQVAPPGLYTDASPVLCLEWGHTFLNTRGPRTHRRPIPQLRPFSSLWLPFPMFFTGLDWGLLPFSSPCFLLCLV